LIKIAKDHKEQLSKMELPLWLQIFGEERPALKNLYFAIAILVSSLITVEIVLFLGWISIISLH